MTRWEYCVRDVRPRQGPLELDVESAYDLEAAFLECLSHEGEDGWELATVVGPFTLILKRPRLTSGDLLRLSAFGHLATQVTLEAQRIDEITAARPDEGTQHELNGVAERLRKAAQPAPTIYPGAPMDVARRQAWEYLQEIRGLLVANPEGEYTGPMIEALEVVRRLESLIGGKPSEPVRFRV